MRILDIGAGAVGSGLASAIAAAGEPIDLIARPQTATAIEALGLRRTGALGEVRIPRSACGCTLP